MNNTIRVRNFVINNLFRKYFLLNFVTNFYKQVNEGVRSQENSNRLEWLQESVILEGLEEVY